MAVSKTEENTKGVIIPVVENFLEKAVQGSNDTEERTKSINEEIRK